MNKILKIPFHSLLFSIFPALALFATNISELKIVEIQNPLIIISVSSLAFWAILSFFVPSRRLAAVVTSLLAFLFFSYQHILKAVQKFERLIGISHFTDNFNYIYLAIAAVLTAGSIYYLLRHKKQLIPITIIFNVISLALMIAPLATVISVQKDRLTKNIKFSTPIRESSVNTTTNKTPDIYYIIVDTYANGNILKEDYNFDNSSFINFLKEKGFYVAENSKSNYPFTITSVASSLNMEYLDDIISQVGSKSEDTVPLIDYTEYNNVIKYLKDKGYKYYHFGPRSFPNQINRYANFNYDFDKRYIFSLSPFSKLLLQQTLVEPFFTIDNLSAQAFNLDRATLSERRNYYDDVLMQINYVPKVVTEDGPKFVFLHALLTHPPFVFNKDGQYVTTLEEGAKSWKDNYTNQLTYANKLLSQLIDGILAGSKSPPIIVLQSDHGPLPLGFRNYGDNYYWKKAPVNELKERIGIMNAYYFPDSDKSMLYQSITPVNSFRVILDKFFGEKLPMLPDRNFFPSYQKYPYDVKDVTNLVK